MEMDMLVADVLDLVPNAEEIFTEHGVNPREECGTAIYSMDLEHACRDCGIDDADALLADLEESLNDAEA